MLLSSIWFSLAATSASVASANKASASGTGKVSAIDEELTSRRVMLSLRAFRLRLPTIFSFCSGATATRGLIIGLNLPEILFLFSTCFLFVSNVSFSITFYFLLLFRVLFLGQIIIQIKARQLVDFCIQIKI